MQQYIFNVPETPEAKTLLNIIIATGYFNQVKEFDEEEMENYILGELMKLDNNNETVSETEVFKTLRA